MLAPCVLAAVLGPGLARAATAVADDGGQTATSVAEIVVTAQKREENLETVPIAISAYTSRQRDINGIDTIQDLTKFTPGLEYSTSLDRAFIRGVGRQTNNLSSQPGVATYFDGVYNSAVVTASGDSLFLDHVEILRGPQGTLYGKNAIGGTINAISRRPTNDFYAEARANFGSYGVYNLEAAVSGPISDDVRFRIAGYRNDRQDSFYNNVAGVKIGDSVVNYLEGQLDARIGSSVDVWIKADAFSWNLDIGSGGSPSRYDYTAFPPGSLLPNAAFGFTQPGFTEIGSATDNPGVTNLRGYSNDTPSRSHLSNDYTAAAQVTWHTPWGADLKYIGGYTQYLYQQQTDGDGTSLTSFQFPTVPSSACDPAPQCPPLTVFPSFVQTYFEDKSSFSNELNLASTGSRRLQWIGGLFEYHEQIYQGNGAFQPSQPQWTNPVNGPPNPSSAIASGDQRMQADSYAAFAQFDWSITPQVKFSGGMRYTYDSQSGVEQERLLCFGVPDCGAPAAILGALTPVIDITQFAISFAPAPGVVGPPALEQATGFYDRRLAASWSGLTGTAGIEWTPDAHLLVYAKYSRGYKAGGFNSGGIFAAPETQAEFLDDYEVGFKRDFGRSLRVNAAAFYYNYDGMQIPLFIQPPDGPGKQEFINLGQVNSYGVELETTWRPIDDLQIIFNYAYLSATIHASGGCFVDNTDPMALQPGANTSGCPAGGSQNVVGQTIPEAPRNKLALAGNYTLHFAKHDLTFSADFAWTDQTYYSIFNRFYNLAPAYDTVDLRMLLTDLDGRYTAILYGKNIFNTLGYDNAGSGLSGDGTIVRGFGLTPPATYGVELQYRFR